MSNAKKRYEYEGRRELRELTMRLAREAAYTERPDISISVVRLLSSLEEEAEDADGPYRTCIALQLFSAAAALVTDVAANLSRKTEGGSMQYRTSRAQSARQSLRLAIECLSAMEREGIEDLRRDIEVAVNDSEIRVQTGASLCEPAHAATGEIGVASAVSTQSPS